MAHRRGWKLGPPLLGSAVEERQVAEGAEVDVVVEVVGGKEEVDEVCEVCFFFFV